MTAPVTVCVDGDGDDHPFVVPSGVTSVDFEVRGASGGGSGDVAGAVVTGTLDVTPGQTLTLRPGVKGDSSSGGFPDGGDPGAPTDDFTGDGGGGSSTVLDGATPLVVAGGGGGASGNGGSDSHGGTPDADARAQTIDGDGGTTSAPGAGGTVVVTGAYDYGDDGHDGTQPDGGDGGDGANENIVHHTETGTVNVATTSGGEYASGPRGVYSYLLPYRGFIHARYESVTTPSSTLTFLELHLTTTPGDPDLDQDTTLLGTGTFGPGGTIVYENTSGGELTVYLWFYVTGAAGDRAYTLSASVVQGPIDPGSGGGGGYGGGGGGASSVDEGASGSHLTPNGVWGGGGGGGSSYVDTGETSDVAYDLGDVGDDGRICLTYVRVVEGQVQILDN